ncbi:MAG TPA: hypothetical protein VLB09_08640, partial [Nitrospiria bacterium]|nr:hypothetical protein [Nitrospiria bacterium]
MRLGVLFIMGLAFPLFSPSPGLTDSKKIAGEIQKEAGQEGCSCRLRLVEESDALVYTSDMNGEKARMNLHEEDVDLKNVGDGIPAELKDNQPYLLEYEHGSVTVSMVCLPKPCSGEGCEGFGVSATV